MQALVAAGKESIGRATEAEHIERNASAFCFLIYLHSYTAINRDKAKCRLDPRIPTKSVIIETSPTVNDVQPMEDRVTDICGLHQKPQNIAHCPVRLICHQVRADGFQDYAGSSSKS